MRPEFIDSEVVTLFTAVHLKNKTLTEALLALKDYSKKNEFIVEFYYGKALVYYHKNLTEKSIDILEFIIKKNAIFILFKIERENFMELKKSCQCKDISPLCQIESLAHLHNPFEVHGG